MIDVIWNSLLELRRLLSSCDQKNFSVQILYSQSNYHVQLGVAAAGQKPEIKFTFDDKTNYSQINYCWDKNFDVQAQQEIPEDLDFQFIDTYLPYCFSTLKSHKLKRAYGISHYAQSLDGKIATFDGHSKWISDQEDLTHCHRMRSLCDSILIGMNTLRNDKPRLNVRHVKGNNPIKVVVGSSSASFSSLMEYKEKIILFTSESAKILQGVEQVSLPMKAQLPVFIMKHLYKMGIHSVFIEGGSRTSSSFLKNKMIDEIQLYVAPIIFGSGLPNFDLPQIRHVKDAVGFSSHQFKTMGEGMFFKGKVKWNTHKRKRTSIITE